MKVRKSLAVLAWFFIIGGIILTLENYNIIGGISKNWPVMLIMLGVGFAMLFFQIQRDAALAWISSFLVMNGFFFYYLNYHSWMDLSYLWPIFLGLVGMSFFISGLLTRKWVLSYIAVFFVIIFLALFLAFTISIRLWPMSLVMFGLSLLVIELFPGRKER
ncbi:MAG: hypothetical protein AABY09_00445 [Nanoarchaeota archaeon]